MDRITKKDLYELERALTEKYGYLKYKVGFRYNYTAIDIYKKDGGCLDTYRTGMTKRETYYCMLDLLNG